MDNNFKRRGQAGKIRQSLYHKVGSEAKKFVNTKAKKSLRTLNAEKKILQDNLSYICTNFSAIRLQKNKTNLNKKQI